MQFREEANAINIHVKCECEILLNSDSKKKVNLRSNEENDNLQKRGNCTLFTYCTISFFYCFSPVLCACVAPYLDYVSL